MWSSVGGLAGMLRLVEVVLQSALATVSLSILAMPPVTAVTSCPCCNMSSLVTTNTSDGGHPPMYVRTSEFDVSVKVMSAILDI